MFFLTTCFLFSVLLPFTITLELVQQHLRCNTSLWSQIAFSFFLRLLPFDFIGYYMCFGINNSRFLSRLRCQDFSLRRILLFVYVHHVCREWMLINLHRPFGSFKFKLPLLESQLNLLTKDFAFIRVMRGRIVPLAIFYVFELLF